MAVKPTNTARWAETAGGTPSADIVEPSSGKKDEGWQPGEEPPCETQNWWQNAVHQWIKYLDAGSMNHGERTLHIPAIDAVSRLHDAWIAATSECKMTSAGVGDELYIPIPLVEGDRIKQVTFWIKRAGGTVQCRLMKKTIATGVATVQGSQNVTTGTTYTSVSISSLTLTLDTSAFYWISVLAGDAGDEVHSVTVTYDRVA